MIPTAEEKQMEFISLTNLTGKQNRDIQTALCEFAKIHVEAALKAASEKAMIDEDVTSDDEYSDDEQELNSENRRIITHSGGHIREEHYVETNKQSILTAYDLNLIK